MVQLKTLRAAELTLRPIEERDLGPLMEIVTHPSVEQWWGDASDGEKLRRDLMAEDQGAFAIEVDGELAGWLGVWEEDEPDYRYGGLDIVLAPDHQDRGIGPRALRMAIDWMAEERGHHRFTIDPAAENARAIRAYEKVGFRPVGVMRKYWRGAGGPWRDGLLMDLLVEELE